MFSPSFVVASAELSAGGAVVSTALSVADGVVFDSVVSDAGADVLSTAVGSGAKVLCGVADGSAVLLLSQAIIGMVRTSSKSIAVMRTSFIFSTPLALYLYFTIKFHPCQVPLIARAALIQKIYA